VVRHLKGGVPVGVGGKLDGIPAGGYKQFKYSS
jgi:hypothetical protein